MSSSRKATKAFCISASTYRIFGSDVFLRLYDAAGHGREGIPASRAHHSATAILERFTPGREADPVAGVRFLSPRWVRTTGY
jgi:hypothetical protein